MTLDQIAAIRAAAASWRTQPGLPGPKPDGQVRDIIEVLLGTAMRTGEVLALRPCDVDDRRPSGMVVAVTGTVVQRKGQGAVRQDRPKSDASIRWIPLPEFAAMVLRRRIPGVNDTETIFANRKGGPLSPYNVRRTFREFLVEAGLADSGISLRWYRRTGATVIARGMGSDAAAAFLGHASTSAGRCLARLRRCHLCQSGVHGAGGGRRGRDDSRLEAAQHVGRAPSRSSGCSSRRVGSPSGVSGCSDRDVHRRSGLRSRRRERAGRS